MRKTFATMFATALLLWGAAFSGANSAHGQEIKPVVVVSITSADRLLENVDTLAKITENEGTLGNFKPFIDAAADGIDRKKPIGLIVTADGFNFKVLGFVAVTDFKGLMARAQAEDAGDGTYEIRTPGMPLFAKEGKGWAFVSQNSDSLESLPDDPSKLLGGQEKEYDICVRAHVQNIPQFLRETALSALKAGVENADRLDGESEEEFQARMSFAKQQIDQLITIINDTQSIGLGWSVDESDKKTFIDFNWLVKPGSETAKRVKSYESATTRFSGFLPEDASATYKASQAIGKEDADQFAGMIKPLRDQLLREIDKEAGFDDDSQRETVKSAVNKLIDSLEATLDSGKFDAAAGLVMAPDAVTATFAAQIGKAENIEKALKELVELVKDEPDFPGVKWDAETHKGVRFHTMSIPIPDDKAQRFLGEKMDVVLGIDANSVYLAAGRDAAKSLKAALDRNASAGEKPGTPGELTVSLAPIMNFAASVDEAPPQVKALADEINKFKGKDRVLIKNKALESGWQMRLEVEEGVLNLIGKAIAASATRRGAF